jgi:hypothetical protein
MGSHYEDDFSDLPQISDTGGSIKLENEDEEEDGILKQILAAMQRASKAASTVVLGEPVPEGETPSDTDIFTAGHELIDSPQGFLENLINIGRTGAKARVGGFEARETAAEAHSLQAERLSKQKRREASSDIERDANAIRRLDTTADIEFKLKELDESIRQFDQDIKLKRRNARTDEDRLELDELISDREDVVALREVAVEELNARTAQAKESREKEEGEARIEQEKWNARIKQFELGLMVDEGELARYVADTAARQLDVQAMEGVAALVKELRNNGLSGEALRDETIRQLEINGFYSEKNPSLWLRILQWMDTQTGMDTAHMWQEWRGTADRNKVTDPLPQRGAVPPGGATVDLSQEVIVPNPTPPPGADSIKLPDGVSREDYVIMITPAGAQKLVYKEDVQRAIDEKGYYLLEKTTP